MQVRMLSITVVDSNPILRHKQRCLREDSAWSKLMRSASCHVMASMSKILSGHPDHLRKDSTAFTGRYPLLSVHSLREGRLIASKMFSKLDVDRSSGMKDGCLSTDLGCMAYESTIIIQARCSS